MRCLSLALIFLGQLLLTHSLGLTAFGTFAFALTWMKTLSIGATLGLERLIVREVAAAAVTGGSARAKEFVIWARQKTLGASAVVAAAASLLFAVFITERDWLPVLWIALAILPLLAVTRITQHVLTGSGRPIAGQIPELILQPLLFVGFGLGAAKLGWLGAVSAMVLQVAAWAAVAVASALLLRRMLPKSVGRAASFSDFGHWRRNTGAMVIVSGATALLGATPVLLLGLMQGAEGAGVLAVAKSVADLAAVPAAAFGAVLAPRVGRLWAQNDADRLQQSFTSVARASALASAATALALIFASEPLLGLFGPGFDAGTGALAVLLVAQVASSLAGPNALLLSIAGQERTVARASAACATLGLAMAAALIPLFQLEGAAAGAAIASIAWNLWLAAAAHRLTGIRAGVLGRAVERPASRR